MEEANVGLAQKSELMDRLNSDIKKADVSSLNFDSEHQILTLQVSDIQWDQAVTGVSCDVWTGEEKQNLRTYQGQLQEMGSYMLKIPLGDFENQPGIYSVSVRLELEDGSVAAIGDDKIEIRQERDRTPSASVVATPYDFLSGKLILQITNLQGCEEAVQIHCSVWSAVDRSDLQWYDAVKMEDGSYQAEIFGEDFGYRHAAYTIHVYAVDSAGNETMIGGCYAEMN